MLKMRENDMVVMVVMVVVLLVAGVIGVIYFSGHFSIVIMLLWYHVGAGGDTF